VPQKMTWKSKEAFMARPGVTYHEVSIIAQRLIAAGKNPTIDAIRMELGTGSNSTLGAHLRTFKDRQSETSQIATKENIPEELIAVIKGLWERVMTQSEDKIQTIQQETAQDITQLRQEVQSLLQSNANWQQQFQKAKQERDAFSHEKSTLEQLLANSKIEAAGMTEKLIGLEQKVVEKQMRIDELHTQHKQTQANLEHYRTASLEQRTVDQQRFEQQQKISEQTILQMNKKLTQAIEERLTLQQQCQKNIFENENLKSELNKLNAQHEITMMRLSNVQNELAKSTQNLDQLHTLKIEFDEQNKILIELKTQHALTQQQLEAEKLKSKEMGEQNKELASEKWILGQEKAQLYGQLKQFNSECNQIK
jgi:chromosome segregation ATPase